METNESNHRIVFKFGEALYKKLKAEAKAMGVPMSTLVRFIVNKHFQEEEK